MNEQSNIEKNVMRRVYSIRVLGLIISTIALAITTLILALWGIGREVWVARVFENGPQDVIGHALYLGYALIHTRLIVQILAVFSFISFLYLSRATFRALSAPFVSANP